MRGYTVGGTGYMQSMGNIGGHGYMKRGASGMGYGGEYGYGGSAMNSRDGYATGGAGGYGGALDPWTEAYNKARAANESRYQDILKGYGKRYDNSMAQLATLGQQQVKDIDKQFKGVGATMQQGLTSRGLTGTTVLPTMQTGVAREQAGAQARAAESLTAMKLDMQNKLHDDILQFKERRTDGYPDLQQMAQLYGAYGAGGGAYGGGGMSMGAGAYGGMANVGYGAPAYSMPSFFQQQYGYGNNGGNRNSGQARQRTRPSVNAYDLPNVGDWGANSNINQLPGTPWAPPTTLQAAMVPGRNNPRNRDYLSRRRPTGNDMQYA